MGILHTGSGERRLCSSWTPPRAEERALPQDTRPEGLQPQELPSQTKYAENPEGDRELRLCQRIREPRGCPASATSGWVILGRRLSCGTRPSLCRSRGREGQGLPLAHPRALCGACWGTVSSIPEVGRIPVPGNVTSRAPSGAGTVLAAGTGTGDALCPHSGGAGTSPAAPAQLPAPSWILNVPPRSLSGALPQLQGCSPSSHLLPLIPRKAPATTPTGRGLGDSHRSQLGTSPSAGEGCRVWGSVPCSSPISLGLKPEWDPQRGNAKRRPSSSSSSSSREEMPPGLPRGHREEKDTELGRLCRGLGTRETLPPLTLPAAS